MAEMKLSDPIEIIKIYIRSMNAGNLINRFF